MNRVDINSLGEENLGPCDHLMVWGKMGTWAGREGGLEALLGFRLWGQISIQLSSDTAIQSPQVTLERSLSC